MTTNAARPRASRTAARLACALVAFGACIACRAPEPPPTHEPPEPQPTPPGDAIQAPIDKARAAEDEVEEAADAQRAAIDAAGG